MASRATVKAISEDIGVKISESIDLEDLSKDAESFIGNILDLANRIRKKKSQICLRVADLNDAIEVRTGKPLYGYRSNNCDIDFASSGFSDGLEILSGQDKQVSLANLANSPLKKYPIDTCFTFHWLAVNGVQPNIPENFSDSKPQIPMPRSIGLIPDQLKLSDQPVTMITSKLMVTKELQTFFFKAIETIKKQVTSSSSIIIPEFDNLTKTLSTDSAIQPLLQFFIRFLYETYIFQGRVSSQIQYALTILEALFSNPNLDCEPFLFNFISITMTIMIHQNIADDSLNGSLSIRSQASDFLGIIVKKYSNKAGYEKLQQRIAEHLFSVILDNRVPTISQFGATLGLYSIDPGVFRNYLIPNIDLIIQRLQAELKQGDPTLRSNAMHLYAAILRICGLCYYHDIVNLESSEDIAKIYSKAVAFFGNDFTQFTVPS